MHSSCFLVFKYNNVLSATDVVDFSRNTPKYSNRSLKKGKTKKRVFMLVDELVLFTQKGTLYYDRGVASLKPRIKV